MGVEGGMKCVKYLLFFFNIIFWMCGLALVILGIMVQMTLYSSLVIKDVSASAAPIVIIVVGVVIFFVAFFGCCGAWKENTCMVTMFAVLLSLIIIIEVAAAIAGYAFRGKITGIVKDSLTEMIGSYSNSSKFQDAVDKLQTKLTCCGVNNSSDWRSFASGGNTVPDSCCVTVTKGCGVGTMTDGSKVHQNGCQEAVEQELKKNVLWVIVAALVIAFIQVMGIVFSCLLLRGIRSGYEVM